MKQQMQKSPTMAMPFPPSTHSTSGDGNNITVKSNPPPSSSSSSLPSSSSAPPPSFPKPSELIDRYVGLGMGRDAASEKVIEDLQMALQRSLYPMQKLMSLEKSFRTTAAQMDVATNRIHLIEAKLDSKPELPQIFLSGLAAGAFLNAAASSTPAVVAALSHAFTSISKSLQNRP